MRDPFTGLADPTRRRILDLLRERRQTSGELAAHFDVAWPTISRHLAVLREAGLAQVPVFGLAKRNEELFAPGVSRPIIIEKDSPTLFLLQRVRDEAHRFAITHHRARRSRSALRSRLDVVPGLGPVRKRTLLRRFGSIDGIRAASVEALSEEVPRPVALSIKELL